MVKKGFVVVGFVTDGEWNLNRTQGSSSLCNSALNECKKRVYIHKHQHHKKIL